MPLPVDNGLAVLVQYSLSMVWTQYMHCNNTHYKFILALATQIGEQCSEWDTLRLTEEKMYASLTPEKTVNNINASSCNEFNGL